MSDELSPSSFLRSETFAICWAENSPRSIFIGARYMYEPWKMSVFVISVVPLTRPIHVTASEPTADVEPPSVTCLNTLKPAKPVNLGARRNWPVTSVPHELDFARFLKLIDV